MRITKYNILLIILLLLTSCVKEESYKDIPIANINVTIYPDGTEYIDLNTVGGWIYLTAPYPSKGILIYRISSTTFMAYERTCTFDPDELDAKIIVDETYMIAKDTVCGSQFLLTDGYPIVGPATRPLRQYRTEYDGYALRIF